MRIGMSSYLFNSSIVLILGLYFRERSSTLYTVITVGKVVKISSHTIGRAVMVKLGLTISKTVSY